MVCASDVRLLAFWKAFSSPKQGETKTTSKTAGWNLSYSYESRVAKKVMLTETRGRRSDFSKLVPKDGGQMYIGR